VTRHHSCRVSPFGHPRIHARLTAPRGISQPPTSFIGSQCQGIHHAPLNTYNTKPKAIFQTLKLHIRHQKAHTTQGQHAHIRCLDARNHYPQIKHHTPPPKMERQPVLSPVPQRGEEIAGLLSQSPIVCPMINCRPPPSEEDSPQAGAFVVHPNHTHYRRGPSNESLESPNPHTMRAGLKSRGAP
jgi:hypothetical protein